MSHVMLVCGSVNPMNSPRSPPATATMNMTSASPVLIASSDSLHVSACTSSNCTPMSSANLSM